MSIVDVMEIVSSSKPPFDLLTILVEVNLSAINNFYDLYKNSVTTNMMHFLLY